MLYEVSFMNLNKVGNLVCGYLFFSILLFLGSCDPDPDPVIGAGVSFETIPESHAVTPGIIDEASGLAASASMPGYLWTIQDSGQPNSLYLISQDGKNIKEFKVSGTANRDWEEVALGPGPEGNLNYIYIGDIGNNNSPIANENVIYRIPEIGEINGSFNETSLAKITFSYPDGAKDAEAMIVDPVTKDIFIISKEMERAVVYRLAYPQSLTSTIIGERIGTIPNVAFTTGGSISADGNEILVRNYFSAFYWTRKDRETVGQVLLRAAKPLMIATEPQGEAICFDRGSKGFYSLSEKGTSNGVSLNYYKKK
jgi:hypothetical protein